MLELLDKIENTLENKKTAILCVDCQNGFTLRCKNELPVPDTDEDWIKKINIFIKEMMIRDYKIYASKDNHPDSHSSFKEWPVHCVKGTYGNELFLDYHDYLVKKGTKINTDSYSAFYDDQKTKTANKLQSLLEINEIDNLIIFGLAGDVCVIATIITALRKGYNVYIIKDFIKSVSGEKIEEILKKENIYHKIKILDFGEKY